MFIEDLSAKTFCPSAHEGVASFSVGWLGDSVPRQGSILPEVIRLLRYCALHYEYQDTLLGYHICEICGHGRFHGEFWVELLDSISGHRIRFVLPLAVFHYIEEHGYCPPQEFLDAIMTLALNHAAQQA